ncbi:hypothetical protein Tco_0660471 [Tanacetum coccineum]
MYCDNTGAIIIANESGITKGARHFRAKVHYLREVIEFYEIKLEKVHTNDNLVDPFTKTLAFLKHSKHTRNIGMLPANTRNNGGFYVCDEDGEVLFVSGGLNANSSAHRGFNGSETESGCGCVAFTDTRGILKDTIPPALVAPAGQQVAPEILASYTPWVKGSKEIVGLMLMTIEPEIQRNMENLHAHEMLQELKTLFAQQAEQELLQTTRDFHSCKQEEGQSVSSYVLKIKGYIDI